MSEPSYRPRGRYFEEFQVGDVVVSAGRTITETDVVNFAALSGDYNQIHVDAEFARNTHFGRRVAHGLLVLSIGAGLADQTGFIEGTVLAFRELTWKFSRPVFFDDTVHLKAKVTELKPLARLGGGTVILKVSIINQNDQVVAHGNWNALIASKPAE